MRGKLPCHCIELVVAGGIYILAQTATNAATAEELPQPSSRTARILQELESRQEYGAAGAWLMHKLPTLRQRASWPIPGNLSVHKRLA